jgi:hypothetical protein
MKIVLAVRELTFIAVRIVPDMIDHRLVIPEYKVTLPKLFDTIIVLRPFSKRSEP